MPTCVLDVMTKAYPSITNRIRASVYRSFDPFALVATIIDTTVGHPSRVFHFPGLPRDNYGFSLDEIDGGGTPINNLALFDVVPGTIDGLLQRNDEQPQVGITTGFVAGATSFTFDGTGGKPDYTNWEIVPSELTGRGILVRGVDYSWDKVTGILQLLLTGDVFANGNYYNIHFEPIQNPAGNSYPTITDFDIVLITTDTSTDVTYFGKKVIAEPVSQLIEVTLPDILTVPQGRKMLFEHGGADLTCVKFKPFGGTTINWLRGNIFTHPGESLSIYRFHRGVGDDEWRVDDADGNFKTVGLVVGDDEIQGDVFNRQIMNGLIADIRQYARIYNEVVLNLPLTQVVDYDAWATGNNKYFFSKSNSADPGNLNKFHFPDRRGLFEKNNSSGKAGDFSLDKIKEQVLNIELPLVQHTTSGLPRGVTDGPLGGSGSTILPITIGDAGATETQPKNYLINKYVLI